MLNMLHNILVISLLLLTFPSFASDNEEYEGFTLIPSGRVIPPSPKEKESFDYPGFLTFVGLDRQSVFPPIKNSQEIAEIESKEEALEVSLRKEANDQLLPLISSPDLFTSFKKPENKVIFKALKLREFMTINSDLPEIVALYFRASDEQRKIIHGTIESKQILWKAKIDHGTKEVESSLGNLFSENDKLSFSYSIPGESRGKYCPIKDEDDYIITYLDKDEKCIKNIYLKGKEISTLLNGTENLKKFYNCTHYQNIYIQPAND